MHRSDNTAKMLYERREANLIELHKPELERQTRARGIATDILLGVIAWIATIALALAIWRWIAG